MKHNAISIMAVLALGVGLCVSSTTARANVYATNIKINGDMTNSVSVGQGSSVNISYILNEAATAGVTLKILSGQNAVRTISIPAGPGTAKGSNTVVWDGKDGTGGTVSLGTYGISISAAATGYTNWTQISDDAAPTSYCIRPRGIAVNNNTNSPFYGRIFIGNSRNGPGVATNAWGDVPGIYIVNADGSMSTDAPGSFGTAGYNFTDATHYDGGDNPLNMKVREDDRLYWNNWVGKGEIVACDMLMTSNQIVMPEGYYSGNPYYPADNWKTFEVTDVLTDHARLYLCDAAYPSGGVWYWPMTNGAVDFNDAAATIGYQAVQTGGDLSLRCDGIAIDANTNVYVIQERDNPGDPNMRAACFTNWDGITPLFSGAAWVVGAADDTFTGGWNMSLDSANNPHYLAVALYFTPPGGIRILDVKDGSTVVTNLSSDTGYRTVNWDNVGNLYAGSQLVSRWRVFSPPGANQATTLAFSKMEVVAQLRITGITLSGGNAVIGFTGSPADAAAAFKLQSAASPAGTFGDVTDASVTQVSPGVFQATVPASGPSTFYRIKK